MTNKIVIYRFTGRQGFFYIPEKWCPECDLLINLIKKTIKEYRLTNSTQLIIRPWWLWFWAPLIKYGNFHAPQLIINNKLISAGSVPEKNAILKALNVNKSLGAQN